MSKTTKKQAVRAFIKQWCGKGYERGESQSFWHSLLHNVLDIEDPTQIVEFEIPVKTLTKEKGSDFIDAYIHSTKVLIEQKSSNKNLSDKIKQSDGSILSPYQQARRYAEGLPLSLKPRWIVCCNFTTFEIHDMEHPNDEPQIIELKDLEKDYYRLDFLVKTDNLHLKKEEVISLQAGEIVGALYDKLLEQYKNPENPESQKSLNKLCVRLVFCLYAEDAAIFGAKNMFHDYLSRFEAAEFRGKLIKLFRILDTKPEHRDPYEEEQLLAFPYVNGGMFSGDIEIPRITDEIRALILQRASDDFDWSLISPTIFGAVFESTLNPETRHAGGMHYTSIENIHKVIDPLFLTDLKEELSQIKAIKEVKNRKQKAMGFQDKISHLRFLDPACGSGNFLTESYTSLRRLENEAIKIIYGKDRIIGDLVNPIKVSINQFYGIEINDFACSVAQTALWIAESQMLQETEEIVGFNIDPLPLKAYTNIKEGNALRLSWTEWEIPESNPSIYANHANIYPTFDKEKGWLSEPETQAQYNTVDVYSSHIEIRQKPEPKTYHVDFDYIMGNPPFIGARIMSSEQKEDLISIFGKNWKNTGNLDYVTGWYKKASDLMRSSSNFITRTALVSTNSITQGEQVANLWKPLMENGIHIDFAWRTFIWDSEATEKAHVHCVIIGFSFAENIKPKLIFNTLAPERRKTALKSDTQSVSEKKICSNINGYLVDGDNIFVEHSVKPISIVPPLLTGSQRIDDNNYVFSDEEKDAFINKEPKSEKYFRRWYGADEFINSRPRWCLYLGKCTPAELKHLPLCLERVRKVKEFRLASNRVQTLRAADTPHKFGLEVIPESFFMIIPVVSSERRRYIPMGFMSPDNLCSNQVNLIPDAQLYHFGILTSFVHMAWMRIVAGRLEMRYRYSKDIVYNNFPWPEPTVTQKERIERTAQGILDARAHYPDSSLADLYDDTTMPIELRKAHRDNDNAVLEAYGLPKNSTENEIVSHLFSLYEKLTSKQ